MARYGYLRVSTEGKGQTTDNQKKLIQDNGFIIDEFFSEDGVSGSKKAMERPAFSRMLEVAKNGDTIVITMVDRLGRSASDILNVVEELKIRGIKVSVLQFDGIDITSSMGKMILTCMAAMAELERNILIERTKAGLERTKEQGTKLGPPLTISPETMEKLCNEKAEGSTLDALQEKYGIPRNTIARNITRWKNDLEAYRNEYEARQAQYSKAA